MASSSPTDFDTRIQSLGMARRTEATHTKMGIKRDESDDLTRKRKGQSDTEPSSIPWDDMTEVSVIALRGFLEDLLGVSHHPSFVSRSSSMPVGGKAARAAQAYQATGRAVHDKNVESVTPPPMSSETHPSSSLESTVQGDFNDADRERMRYFVTRLNDIERQGIVYLSLRRQLGFLDSIDEALRTVPKPI